MKLACQQKFTNLHDNIKEHYYKIFTVKSKTRIRMTSRVLCLLALRVREGYRLSVTTVTSNDAQVRVPQVASLSQHTFYAVLSIHAMIQFLLLFISLDICVIFICSSKTIPLHPSCVMVSFTNSS